MPLRLNVLQPCTPHLHLSCPTPRSLYANGAINPCGQIAQSFFNDTYEISASTPGAGAPEVLQLDDSSIAWSNDYKLYGEIKGGL